MCNRGGDGVGCRQLSLPHDIRKLKNKTQKQKQKSSSMGNPKKQSNGL